MRRFSFLSLLALLFLMISCDDKTKTGDAEKTSSALQFTDTTGLGDTTMAASKVPYAKVDNSVAQKWYKDYVDLMAASKPPATTPFNVDLIVTQITLFDDVSKALRKLSPKKVKFCVALKAPNKTTVLIQVKLQNDTYLYYDMSEPTLLRTNTDEYSFCPPPPGCALEEAP